MNAVYYRRSRIKFTGFSAESQSLQSRVGFSVSDQSIDLVLFASITLAIAEATVIVFTKRVRTELDAPDLAHQISQA